MYQFSSWSICKLWWGKLNVQLTVCSSCSNSPHCFCQYKPNVAVLLSAAMSFGHSSSRKVHSVAFCSWDFPVTALVLRDSLHEEIRSSMFFFQFWSACKMEPFRSLFGSFMNVLKVSSLCWTSFYSPPPPLVLFILLFLIMICYAGFMVVTCLGS